MVTCFVLFEEVFLDTRLTRTAMKSEFNFEFLTTKSNKGSNCNVKIYSSKDRSRSKYRELYSLLERFLSFEYVLSWRENENLKIKK